MKIYKKAILPLGFKAGGLSCGIKKSAKPDLALVYSEFPAKASGLFTCNKIQAAPLKVCRNHLKTKPGFRALIINSGNANCLTGKTGFEDALKTCSYVGAALGVSPRSVLVASTGIIGRRLPLVKIKSALPVLVRSLSGQGIHKAKRAILTTDTLAKEITVKFNIGADTLTVCGIAKGAGMIAPDMATMLSFIFTDCLISQAGLNQALKIAVENSFNCITVDGCMSTNDSVIILANGAKKNKLIDPQHNFKAFSRALNFVCLELAKMIVRDAEGATKFIRIQVIRAKDSAQARKAALFVANSNLFKAAMFGENPNFGRIAAGLGASGIDLSEKGLKIKVSPLQRKEINVWISLNRGKASATVYTSDLSPAYVKINAAYN